MNQVALLSLPNSGSDWLVDTYLGQSGLRYNGEFFNPSVCREERYRECLGKAFGSERVIHLSNITAPWTGLPTEIVYQETWARNGLTLTKEVFGQFRVDFFASKFDCFALTRSIEDSLPPKRKMIEMVYEAMYLSLLVNRKFLPEDVRGLTDWCMENVDGKEGRMVAAHVVFSYQLKKEAKRLGVPVLEYGRLMSATEAELVEELKGLPGVRDVREWARRIVSTRKKIGRDFDSMGVGDVLDCLNGMVKKLEGL